MGQHGLWIPAAERAEAKAVQNVVAVAVAMAMANGNAYGWQSGIDERVTLCDPNRLWLWL